jgi:hypothetical protein
MAPGVSFFVVRDGFLSLWCVISWLEMGEMNTLQPLFFHLEKLKRNYLSIFAIH